MNYYQYKRRAPRRRRGADYVKPFIVLIIFAAILVAGWRMMGSLFVNEDPTESSEKVMVEIETGSAKAMTAAGNEWKNIPSNIFLYQGEKVKTQSDGRMTLNFFEGSLARMDKSSELVLETLAQDGIAADIKISAEEGNIWVNTTDSTGLTNLELHTENFVVESSVPGVFAITAPDTLYVIKGRVTANVLSKGKVIKSMNVGVGQQLVVTPSVIADLSEGLDKEVLFALDDSFESSNWFRWNRSQEGQSVEASDDETAEESEELTDDEETEDAVDESETADEEEEVAEDEAEEEEVDENDKEAPRAPSFTDPGENDDVVEIDDTVQLIKGTVSSDTNAVIVNDYRLTKYEPGSGSFTYTASVAFANLEAGENKYEAIAVDKAGNKSEVATITLVLPEEVAAEAEEDEEEEVTSEAEEATSTGGVSITSPNGGENLATSETSFTIEGTVPEGTSKVLVNNYQLQGFSEGDTSFKYNANSTLGTLEIGEKNTYTAEAYDADDELIGSASMTIDVESSESGAATPTITIPTSAATYDTTLSPVALGGTVGKWVDKVYVNGAMLNDYIPGSEEWATTVELSAGENEFSVYGQTDGENSDTVSITVNFSG